MQYDAVVIGGGFYGLYLSEYLARRFRRVLLCERMDALMTRASYNNQARIHNGYHYPRSILTALRSRMNFPRFVAEFAPAVDASFDAIYAVGRRLSKVSADQFLRCMRRINAPIQPASKRVRALFSSAYVEAAFTTTEHAFNAKILRDLMSQRVAQAGVEVRLQTEISQVVSRPDGSLTMRATGALGDEELWARHVFCCGYSQLNQPTAGTGVEIVPLKHELAELALVDTPPELQGLGVTIMDGPFFSCMPFPDRSAHTLTHVRYTPHGQWFDGQGAYRPPYDLFAEADKKTAVRHMLHDAARYLPKMAECRYRESLWEVKTLLPRSEMDDSRPIMFKRDFGGLPNYHLLMGGKIDNVYDVLDLIGETYGWGKC